MSAGDDEPAEAHLELRRAGAGVEVFALDGAETTIGRSPANNVCIDDERASRVHAVIRRTGRAGWRITDLDSTNGTFVNDQPVRADRPLRDRDRVRLGDSELVFCAPEPAVEAQRRTIGVVRTPPDITRRERDVLVALCGPLFGREAFPAPASTRQICAELFITESAVRHHLDRLYDKFAIFDGDPEERRRQLATEAIRRGAVTEPDER